MGIADVLSARQKVGWGWSGTDEGEHTGTPVPIWADGPGANRFVGFDEEPNESVGQALLDLVTP